MCLRVDSTCMQPGKKPYECLQPKASFTPFAAYPDTDNGRNNEGAETLYAMC